MIEIIIINVGSFSTLFCAYKFALNHLAIKFTNIFDAIIRFWLVVGVISGSLLMPIWLQKSRYPDVPIGFFLIGIYVGIGMCILTAWLEKRGTLKWPKSIK